MVTSSEFRLAVECCRSSFQLRDADRLAELCAAVDWPLFVRLTRFHRVQGLVSHGLGPQNPSVPALVAGELSSDATAIAAANLRSAAECRELLSAFDDAGISLLFVKGLTLGALAYGNIAWKSAIDIDLLVARERLTDAARLLQSKRYRFSDSKLDRSAKFDRLEAWHGARKESSWIDPRRKLQIDLHTRLSDNPRLIPSIGLNSTRRVVKVAPGISLPTLGIDELFAYLCVHGASSAWFRLKWISDFAALVSNLPPAEIVKLYRQSQDLGAGRAAGQALLLADSLFGSLEQLPTLRDELQRDAAIRRLHTAALKQLAGSPEPVEPTSTPLGTLRIHWTQFLLQRGARFKWSELVRQVRVMLP